MPAQSHRWTITAIADRVATIEVDGDRMVHLPHWVLPLGAHEGDILDVRHDLDAAGDRSSLTIEIDRAATDAALRQSERQVGAMRRESQKRDPGGDVSF